MASQYVKLPVTSGGGGGGAVDSFNGRTGVVVSQAGDYSAAIVSNNPAGNISATNVQAAINELDTEKQAVITGAATTITSSNLTADRALQSNASGKVAVSTVTSTELGHLSGVTSALQTQLDSKQPLDAELTSLAALSSNGLLTRTGAGVITARTITSDASITVVNGGGVLGAPTLSLPTSGATAGTYLNANVTVNDRGIVTAIANGNTMDRDPDTQIRIYDDFTGGTPSAGAYTFTISNAGTGAGSTVSTTGIDATLKALGVMSMATGTTNTGRTAVTTGTSPFVFGLANFDVRSRLWLSTAGTVADQYEFTFGLIDNAGAGTGHTDGAYFRFFGNGVNTNWQIVTAAGGVLTTTTTSVPVLVNNASIFQIIVNESGTLASFYIDDVLVGSHTTNIPTFGQFFGYGWKNVKTTGTTSITHFVDWGYLAIDYSTPRG